MAEIMDDETSGIVDYVEGKELIVNFNISIAVRNDQGNVRDADREINHVAVGNYDYNLVFSYELYYLAI